MKSFPESLLILLAVDELAVAWLDDEGCFGALDELVGVRLRATWRSLREPGLVRARLN